MRWPLRHYVHDLTHPVSDGMPTYPGDPPVAVDRAADVSTDGSRVTALRCDSHAGTHVDAPAHTESDGATLDAFPVGRFAMDAALVDCRSFGAREPIPPESVPDGTVDCAVFHTGRDETWGTDRYHDHPSLAPATARRCVTRGYDVALDAGGPDPGPAADGGDGAGDVPAHRSLLGAGHLFLVFENLTGLDVVPDRFERRASPLALDGDGAPVRAVAAPRSG